MQHRSLNRQKTSRQLGYSISNILYSPKYEDESTHSEIDQRSTLFWDPLIKTDIYGKADSTFYNTDLTGEVHVVVEGVNY